MTTEKRRDDDRITPVNMDRFPNMWYSPRITTTPYSADQTAMNPFSWISPGFSQVPINRGTGRAQLSPQGGYEDILKDLGELGMGKGDDTVDTTTSGADTGAWDYWDAQGYHHVGDPVMGDNIVGYDPSMATKDDEADQRAWEEQQAQRQYEQQMAMQQMMIDWYRQQAEMQAQAQREATYAQLLTQPMSWLDPRLYNPSYGGGGTPSVQPWMLPLGMSDYASLGESLPGYQQQGGGGTPMGSLPQLTTPSMQYFARMGDTAQQQWLGYEQARTGSRPEESMFRLQSRAAPTGTSPQLRWAR